MTKDQLNLKIAKLETRLKHTMWLLIHEGCLCPRCGKEVRYGYDYEREEHGTYCLGCKEWLFHKSNEDKCLQNLMEELIR